MQKVAFQRLLLWTVTILILFFVGLAMMLYGFATMTQDAKVFCFIFWFLIFVFAARKLKFALIEFSLTRVSLLNQDKGSSK